MKSHTLTDGLDLHFNHVIFIALFVQGQIYDDTSIEQALVEQQVLEEGFRGTGLFNNTT